MESPGKTWKTHAKHGENLENLEKKREQLEKTLGKTNNGWNIMRKFEKHSKNKKGLSLGRTGKHGIQWRRKEIVGHVQNPNHAKPIIICGFDTRKISKNDACVCARACVQKKTHI